MLEQFTTVYPNVHVIRTDFNHKIEDKCENKFSHCGCDFVLASKQSHVTNYGLYNYIIIYNSIPHFDHLENVFHNVRHLLKHDGVFSIIHARSRKGLREHHEKIGYTSTGEAIPSNHTLMRLSGDYGLNDVIIKDDKYFYFSCSKKNT